MNLRINHQRIIPIELTAQLSVNDSVTAPEAYRSHSHYNENVGALVPELLPMRNGWYIILANFILVALSLILVILSTEFNWIYTRPSAKELNFFQQYWIFLVCPGLPMLLSLTLIKNFSDIRYLLFQGDKAILQGRWDGRRVYAAKDLKFHLLSHFPEEGARCTLEIELPDLSLPEHTRLFMAESTANRVLMDGIMHGLLPLLRGDPSIAQKAKPRPYLGVPKNQGLAPIRRLLNLDSYFCIWIADYKINQFIFWLTHGGPQKVLSLPINQKGNHHDYSHH